MKVGDRSRCLRCGGKIMIIHHPSIISLDTGVWVHIGFVRRNFTTHPAVGPTS